MRTSQNVHPAIARVVAEALAAAGVSQRDASTKSGIALATLTRRLSGGSPFTVAEIDALAAVIGVSPTTLVRRAEKRSAA